MIGQTVLHYKVMEELGRGGMGIVYKAHDTKLKRDVAIKFLPHRVSSSKEDKERFMVEARAAAALNHPNIATIFSIEEMDNQTFIVMEYIDGEELKDIISKGLMKVEDAVNVIIQIAEGLGKAHEKGIIHRDIKSSNIMLTKDKKVKIMDFGLAKLTDNSVITIKGTTLGTAAYMSPEQAQGKSSTHLSDIWSLGVVAYELLTGELPFRAEHAAAWSYVILNDEPTAPSTIDKRIPQQFDPVILKMLEKNPEDRFQNVQELIDRLHNLDEEQKGISKEKKTKVIAVLPFENISQDEESNYFGDGLAEELIVNLSRLNDVKVVSRTTTMQYKGTKKDMKTIGKELGARYIMEGSVRKFQDNLRISAQLIDVLSDTQLWAETFKGKLADVFDIQEQVSKQIVDALMVKLTPTEKVELTKRPTLNAEAFDFNLRARNFLYKQSKNNVQFAIQFFEKAIALDSRYAEAYAGMAEAYAVRYAYFERKENLLDTALELSLKAIMYDSTLAEAYAALGLSYYFKGSFDEALTAVQKALAQDANNFFAYWILGRIYYTTDQEKEAIAPFKKVIELNPDFYTVYSDLRMIYERVGDKEENDKLVKASLDFYDRYLEQNPDDGRARIFHAQMLIFADRLDEAKKETSIALELSPNDNVMLYNAVCVYSRINEKKLAVQTLKLITESGFEHYDWIKRDPDLDNIRNEPEYVELMKDK